MAVGPSKLVARCVFFAFKELWLQVLKVSLHLVQLILADSRSRPQVDENWMERLYGCIGSCTGNGYHTPDSKGAVVFVVKWPIVSGSCDSGLLMGLVEDSF